MSRWDRPLDLLADFGMWCGAALERVGVWLFWLGWAVGVVMLVVRFWRGV